MNQKIVRKTICLAALYTLTMIGPVPHRALARQVNAQESSPALPPSPIQSPAAATKQASLLDFAWLQGQWAGTWGTRVATQSWSAPKAGMMLGTLQIMADDKTTVVEFVTLTQTNAGVQYRVLRFTPSMIPWDKSGPPLLSLMSSDSKRFVFRNASDSQPSEVIFNRIDPDSYVDQMLQKSTDSQSTDITFHRQKASGGNASHR